MSQKVACSTESGATMIEFALVFPVLVILLLFFCDVARVIAVNALLTYAAEETMQQTLTMPNFDVDNRTADPNSPEYQRYLLARRRILQGATRFLLQTSLVTDGNTPSSAQLMQFTYGEPANRGGAQPPVSADVAVLRPGERVRVGDAASAEFLEHNAYPYPGDGIVEPSMERLLGKLPIVVEFRARVQTFTPMLGDIVVRGVAQGYRDLIPRGPMPDEDPAIMASATVWPSPTPSPTAYPYPEPAASPTPGGCVVTAALFVQCKSMSVPSVPDLSGPGPEGCLCLQTAVLQQ